MTKNTEYHEIFVPFKDVYKLGGAEIFKQFERNKKNQKNLVVIPIDFIDSLDNPQENYMGGAEDVLKFLKKTNKEKIRSTNGITTYKVLQGLDIAIIDDNTQKNCPEVYYYDDNNGVSMSKLEEKITSQWNIKEKPIFITNNAKTHIKLGGYGIHIEDPYFLQVNEDIVNEGIIIGNEELQSELYSQEGLISLENAMDILERDLFVNQFIRFMGHKDYEYAKVSADFIKNSSGEIIDKKNGLVELLSPQEHSKKLRIGNHYMNEILGIQPRDMEQYLAFQYGLLNPDVSLFVLCGSQGSGKTLLSYVAAIDQVLWYEKSIRKLRNTGEIGKGGVFKQMILLKPNEIMGGKRRDVGFLPGSLYEKLKPHLAPYIDAHRESSLNDLFPFEEMLKHPKFTNDFGAPREDCINNIKINQYGRPPSNIEMIEMTYSGYMRGRSFRDSLVLIDEAQNLTPYEVKTIIQRLGEGCKGIIMGDPAQVDNPFCSREINGLTHAIQHYIHRDYSALVNLTRNYRSQMSKDATSWKAFST